MFAEVRRCLEEMSMYGVRTSIYGFLFLPCGVQPAGGNILRDNPPRIASCSVAF